MDGLMADRTVFVIAHRLSTVRNAKAIMVRLSFSVYPISGKYSVAIATAEEISGKTKFCRESSFCY